MNQIDFIRDFGELGNRIGAYLEEKIPLQVLDSAIERSLKTNYWFTEYHIRASLRAMVENFLHPQKLSVWLSVYSPMAYRYEKDITIVMAGNIPLVGYHDYLAVLASGRKASVKPSSKDPFLLPALHDLLCLFAPFWRQNVRFVTEIPENADGLIATGSNATASWFKRHFSHLPKMVRGHRVSVAIVHEGITQAQIDALHRDMFLYFGLGCRSVVRLFIPKGFDLTKLTAFERPPQEASHAGFRSAYLRQKAILTLQGHPFTDGGFFLLQPKNDLFPPLATIFYSFYNHVNEVLRYIQEHDSQIQCVVGGDVDSKKCINFGSAQTPQLWDYADDIDTIHLYDIPI